MICITLGCSLLGSGPRQSNGPEPEIGNPSRSDSVCNHTSMYRCRQTRATRRIPCHRRLGLAIVPVIQPLPFGCSCHGFSRRENCLASSMIRIASVSSVSRNPRHELPNESVTERRNSTWCIWFPLYRNVYRNFIFTSVPGSSYRSLRKDQPQRESNTSGAGYPSHAGRIPDRDGNVTFRLRRIGLPVSFNELRI